MNGLYVNRIKLLIKHQITEILDIAYSVEFFIYIQKQF